MLILPCWSKTFSLKCSVAFDAGGCEDLGHWGIHPDSAFVRWYSVVISPTFTEGELRPSEATQQRFHQASGRECRFNLVVCRSLLFAGWMPARPSLAFLSITVFMTESILVTVPMVPSHEAGTNYELQLTEDRLEAAVT